jgi:phosphomevalonate kinase
MSKSDPDLILIISGKRKCGKDYICQKIISFLKTDSKRFSYLIITLSAPLKEIYAETHGLDYQRLLDSSDYKETYRLDMIK